MKRRILFVDDEERVLNALQRMLYKMRDEWDMLFFTDGNEAVGEMASSTVDALVSDLRMPAMSGDCLLEKAHELYPGIIRIVLSAFAPQLTVFKTFLFAHRFLIKPSASEVVIRAIASRLSLRDQMSTEKAQAMLLRMGSISLMPTTFYGLVDLVGQVEPDRAELKRIINSDAALAANLLRFSLFALPKQVNVTDIYGLISSIDTKVIREMIRSGILHESSASTCLRFGLKELSQPFREIAARAEADRVASNDELVSELIDVVGKLLFIDHEDVLYAEVLRRIRESNQPEDMAEHDCFDLTHREAGRLLFGMWGLPNIAMDGN